MRLIQRKKSGNIQQKYRICKRESERLDLQKKTKQMKLSNTQVSPQSVRKTKQTKKTKKSKGRIKKQKLRSLKNVIFNIMKALFKGSTRLYFLVCKSTILKVC